MQIMTFLIGVGIAIVLAAFYCSTQLGFIALVGLLVLHLFWRWMTSGDGPTLDILPPSDGSSDYEVLSETEDELVIRGDVQALILNRSERTVSNIKRRLCGFDEIHAVGLSYSRDSDGGRAGWSVQLLRGAFFVTIILGEGGDEVDASIAAAKLASWIGKPVRA